MAINDDETDDRDDDRPSRKSKAPAQGSNKTLFIILGVVGGVLLLCCGGSAIVFVITANKVSNAAKDIAKQIEDDLKKQQQQKDIKIDEQKDNKDNKENKDIKFLLSKDDTLDRGGPQMLVGRMGGAAEMKIAKAFPVQLSKGKTYIINLTQPPGSMLDPYLTLGDPKGKTVAVDDDGGGFPHARITYTPAINGRFNIMVTGALGTVGAFKLTVEER